MADYPGGCLCGAVRYEVAAYADAGYCHCTRCRRFTGAPVTAWALVAVGDLKLAAGEPKRYDTRRFCGTCGSSLFHDAGDDAVAVYIATLDDPEAIEPQIHQCVETQIAWLRMRDLLPYAEGTNLPPNEDRQVLRGPANPDVTRASVVSLREVTKDNVRQILLSEVFGHQRRFVAPNGVSLAQASFHPAPWHRAIYADDTVVGFVMVEVMDKDELGLSLKGNPYIWRFMIDSRYQGMGFGGRALELVIAELRSWESTREVWLSCVRGAGSPYGMYRRYGFIDTGVVEEGEVMMRLPAAA